MKAILLSAIILALGLCCFCAKSSKSMFGVARQARAIVCKPAKVDDKAVDAIQACSSSLLGDKMSKIDTATQLKLYSNCVSPNEKDLKAYTKVTLSDTNRKVTLLAFCSDTFRNCFLKTMKDVLKSANSKSGLNLSLTDDQIKTTRDCLQKAVPA